MKLLARVAFVLTLLAWCLFDFAEDRTRKLAERLEAHV
jgi:hypothetical protein